MISNELNIVFIDRRIKENIEGNFFLQYATRIDKRLLKQLLNSFPKSMGQ